MVPEFWVQGWAPREEHNLPTLGSPLPSPCQSEGPRGRRCKARIGWESQHLRRSTPKPMSSYKLLLLLLPVEGVS